MSRGTRKIVAALLSAWLLLMSGGYATAVAAEVQHDLECAVAGSDAPVSSIGDAGCPHGCAGHLAAHLSTVAEYGGETLFAPTKADWLPAPDIGAFYSISSPPFLPPKVLLA